MDLVTRARIFQ